MATTAQTAPCRAVTSEEVAHYQEKGWVQLKRFITPEMIATLLTKAKELMGEDGDACMAGRSWPLAFALRAGHAQMSDR